MLQTVFALPLSLSSELGGTGCPVEITTPREQYGDERCEGTFISPSPPYPIRFLWSSVIKKRFQFLQEANALTGNMYDKDFNKVDAISDSEVSVYLLFAPTYLFPTLLVSGCGVE